ncbi:MAG TPA: hypothetical protein VFZ89_14745, partial [Solirubrobacteraceae bacterium]
YEPEAVDAHLARLAGEIEALQRQQGSAPQGGGASLALAASEQVRAIVEAAETSAADIEAAARDDAARIKAEAEAEARGTRDDAVAKSQEHVGKVGEATTTMLQRVDAMESELGALLESLRTGANRLNADLTLLKGNMGDLYGAAGGSAPAEAAPAPAPEPVPAEPPAASDEGLFASTETHAVPDPGTDEIAAAAAPMPPPAEPAPSAPEPPAEVAETVAAPAPQAGTDVDEGARLVAFNMALDGTPREEVDRYLAENFDIADRARLLDEVYSTVG